MTLRLFLTLLVMSVASLGCAKDRDASDDVNDLWRGGYGYNNPNAERIQDGKTPLNFDGSK